MYLLLPTKQDKTKSRNYEHSQLAASCVCLCEKIFPPFFFSRVSNMNWEFTTLILTNLPKK